MALPFKKRPVDSRDEFLGLWTTSKDYIRSVSGKHGAYQENKALRRSEEFKWPSSPPGQQGSGLVTSSGRASGSDRYQEFECPAPKRIPVTEEHLIHKLENVRSQLNDAYAEIAALSAKVEEQNGEMKVQGQKIRSAAKRIVDLQRRVNELGKTLLPIV